MIKPSQAFELTGTDKQAGDHDYGRWYDKIFSKFVPSTLLEVGVKQGKSIAAWKLAFPSCHITGVDITSSEFRRDMIDLSDATIVIGDSTNPDIQNQLDSGYDVIVDDGSHFYKDIISTFSNLSGRFNRIYVIEDVMYGCDEIINHINSLGFTNVDVYDSRVKQVSVDLDWLRTKEHNYNGEYTKVDLKLVVVYRD